MENISRAYPNKDGKDYTGFKHKDALAYICYKKEVIRSIESLLGTSAQATDLVSFVLTFILLFHEFSGDYLKFVVVNVKFSKYWLLVCVLLQLISIPSASAKVWAQDTITSPVVHMTAGLTTK
jgi:hypothetical protein